MTLKWAWPELVVEVQGAIAIMNEFRTDVIKYEGYKVLSMRVY